MTRPSRRCFGTVEDFDDRFATNRRKHCVAAALRIPGPSTRYFYSSVAWRPRACITFQSVCPPRRGYVHRARLGQGGGLPVTLFYRSAATIFHVPRGLGGCRPDNSESVRGRFVANVRVH